MIQRAFKDIVQRAREIENTCALEYPEAGDEAVYQMAVDMRHQGWSPNDVNRLLAVLNI